MRAYVLASALVLVSAFPAGLHADDPAPPVAPPAAPAAASQGGVEFEPGKPAFADVLAKAKAAGKPVFVQFSTDWCGWCRRLEKDTFAKPEVGELMKGFVNVYVDAEKGEGVPLAKKYAARGFPTLVVVDASGEEIDRIVGYLPPKEFSAEIQRIQRGDGTLASLRKQVAESPDDVDASLALGAKLSGTDPDAASALFHGLMDKAKTRDRATQARVLLEYAATLVETGKNDAAAGLAEKLVNEFADTPSAGAAAGRVGNAFVALEAKRALAFLDASRGLAKEPKDRRAVEQLTITVHRHGIAAALRRQAEAAGDDPIALNEVAWTCFEQKVNVREAVGWARKAAEKSGRDAAVLDTLANLLWISGARDEAVKTEEEALGKAEGPMKKEFEGVLARWRAEAEAMKAAGAVPMTPLVPRPAEGGAR